MSPEQPPAEAALNGRIVPAGEAEARPVHLCHHGCDCWQRNFAEYLRTTPDRGAEQLDNVESHALLEAKNRAARLVRRHAGEMDAGRRRLIERHQKALAALDRLRTIVEGGGAGGAVRALERLHAERARTSTPRRPLWLRIIMLPTVVAVGAFDTWYFRDIFQKFVGNADISGLEQVLTLFPGLTLTIGIVIAGTVLGGPLHRAARLHAERQAGREGIRRALAGVGPWLLRLLLPGMLLLVAASWAVYRAREANLTSAQEAGEVTQLALPVDFVTILIVTLTLCALALKIVAYDPYAAEESAARRRDRVTRLLVAWHLRRTATRVTGNALAWSDLCALRDDLVSGISERYGDAYRFMMYARGFHEKAGSLPPTFSTGERGPSLRERIQPELTGVVGPEPDFGALRQVEEAIENHRPHSLQEETARLRDRLVGQRSPSSLLSSPPAPPGSFETTGNARTGGTRPATPRRPGTPGTVTGDTAGGWNDRAP
ncbi:hypothetical protein GCM10017673_26020 [Streptosporangium violaceochromogenes]|nr:hypothetical protein GCM10017673_26020 [Streptosporangium violaceochromogenes]